MKIRLISVGRDRSGLFEPGVQEYAGRIARYAKMELVELPEAAKSPGVPQAICDEGRRILAKVGQHDALLALDERGKSLTSDGLSRWLGALLPTGRDLCVVIGGANGLSDDVRRRADLILSLSAMTLPHRLARLVAAEQLYRAFTILRGEPYHRA